MRTIENPTTADDYFGLLQALDHAHACPCENCKKSLAELDKQIPEAVNLATELGKLPVGEQFKALMEDCDETKLKELVQKNSKN